MATAYGPVMIPAANTYELILEHNMGDDEDGSKMLCKYFLKFTYLVTNV